MVSDPEGQASVPEAIPPVVPITVPNDDVRLYEGPMVVVLDGTPHDLRGSLDLRWLPDPRIQFDGSIDLGWVQLPDESEVRIQGVIPSTSCIVTQASPDGTGTTRLQGILNATAEEGDRQAHVDSIDFVVANFHDCRGRAIRSPDSQGLWAGRQSYRIGEWCLTLDRLREWSAQGTDAFRQGGYVVTHTGRVARADAAAFPVEDANVVMDPLHSWLAFLRGFWVGPILPTGFDGGARRWRRVTAPLLSPWKSVRSWYPRRTLPDLDVPATRFVELWSTPEWRTPLGHLVWWYVEANTAASSESALLMAHTALELLGWAILVETQSSISAEGFDKLPAADKLRVLLGNRQIPLRIPDSFQDLEAYAKSVTESDGPGVLARMRNAIVHPTLKKRRLLAQASHVVKHQARELAIGFLELALLSFLRYDGVYLDRAATGWIGDAERPVPWSM